MAIIHRATITPSKDELVQPWLQRQEWWDGISRSSVGSFRLDDPDGEVGLECFLYGADTGPELFIPLTYRAAPLAGAEDGLLGTMEHSVLGTRWVYDGAADPVFLATVREVVRTGGHEAVLEVHAADGTVSHREPTARARGVDGEGVPDDATVTVLRAVRPGPGTGPRLEGGPVGGPGYTLASVGTA